MKPITLLEIIQKKPILIPEIQRDYVQGRDEIGTKSKILNFTQTLAKKVNSFNIDGNSLVLNFVYGNEIGGAFLPLDGQQRLTTLYLLHLYVWARAGKTSEIAKWKTFNYQVRPTSNRFFNKLREKISDLCEPPFLNESPLAKLRIGGERVTKYDQDINDLSVFLESNCFLVSRPWFKRCWLNDLTVRSAIIALYLIKDAFKDLGSLEQEDYERFCQYLEEGAIVFNYLDIESDLSKTDDPLMRSNEIYVKMNARGKQLTPFENIKAELYERIGPTFLLISKRK